MAVTQPIMLLDEITDFLASSPTPQEIIAFKRLQRLSVERSIYSN